MVESVVEEFTGPNSWKKTQPRKHIPPKPKLDTKPELDLRISRRQLDSSGRYSVILMYPNCLFPSFSRSV